MGKCPWHIPSGGKLRELSLVSVGSPNPVGELTKKLEAHSQSSLVTCGSSPAPGQGLALRSAGLQAGALHPESLRGHHSAQPLCPQHRQVRHSSHTCPAQPGPGPSLGPQAEPGARSQPSAKMGTGCSHVELESSRNSLVPELKSCLERLREGPWCGWGGEEGWPRTVPIPSIH